MQAVVSVGKAQFHLVNVCKISSCGCNWAFPAVKKSAGSSGCCNGARRMYAHVY